MWPFGLVVVVVAAHFLAFVVVGVAARAFGASVSFCFCLNLSRRNWSVLYILCENSCIYISIYILYE